MPSQTDELRAALAGALEPGEELMMAEAVVSHPRLRRKMEKLIEKEEINVAGSTFHARVQELLKA